MSLADIIEQEYRRISKEEAEKVFKEANHELTQNEITEIMKEVLPDLDEVISKKIKQHFVEIAEFIVSKFNEEEEKQDAKTS